MHYLIDGHNLIGQLSDFDLADPDDEAKLVLLLRQWAAGSRKREITVIFDHGLPGGRWRAMSRKQLKAIFAPQNQSADELLIGRINQAEDPKAFTLISSDQRILKAAKSRRMPYITSEAFANQLESIGKTQTNLNERKVVESKPEDLSEEEIAEWLSVFNEPEETRKWGDDAEGTDNKGQNQESVKQDNTEDLQSAVKSTNEPTTLKGGERKLSNEEVDEWLQIFGE